MLTIKQQSDATIYLLKWLKFKTLTIPNAGKDEEKWGLSFIVDGNTKLVQPL